MACLSVCFMLIGSHPLFGAQPGGRAAVHDHGLAGHKRRLLIIRQEIDGVGNFFWRADPPIDRLAGQVVQAGMDVVSRQVTPIQPGAQHGGIHRAGQDGVDADIIRGKFDGNGTRQRQQAALAGGIRGDIRGGLDRVDRGDIDNRPAAGRLQQRIGQFGKQEGRAQVIGDHHVPFFHGSLDERLGNLYGGIIYQRIQGTREGAYLLENGFHRFGMGNLALDEQSAGREILAEGSAIHTDDPPTFFGKQCHAGASDPACRAGNENSLLRVGNRCSSFSHIF